MEHGGEFNGVKVFYAPDNEQLVAMALKMCKSAGGTLVSSGVTMESRATEAGIPVLCSSTFRKAFLQGGMPGGDRGDRGDRGGDERRSGRDRRGGRDRRRDRGDRGERGGQGGGQGGNRAEPAQPEAEGGAGEAPAAADGGGEESQAPKEDNSAVRNLIDLVE